MGWGERCLQTKIVPLIYSLSLSILASIQCSLSVHLDWLGRAYRQQRPRQCHHPHSQRSVLHLGSGHVTLPPGTGR